LKRQFDELSLIPRGCDDHVGCVFWHSCDELLATG
jgi:hypothetical protein